MYIGITGLLASGKDTVADHLIKKGFEHHSLSDEVREETKKRGLDTARPNLVKIANELRRKFGNGIWAKRVLRKAKGENVVFTSIRNPQEIRELKKTGKFILISVSAPIKTRFKRIKKRARENEEKLTFEEFKKQEEKEERSKDLSVQQLAACIKMADYEIINNATVKQLYRKIDLLLKKISK